MIRSWGAIRFDIYSVINIIRRRKYPLKVELYDDSDKLISTDDGESGPGKESKLTNIQINSGPCVLAYPH